MLIGKALYLRGGYLSDTLNFDEHGHLIGHSPQGSFTLCAIQIDHLRLTKHKLELEGLRYGLHFSAQLAYEDSATTFDRVQITPKKKFVHITIDREIVVKPKKEPKSAKNKKAPATPGAKTPPAPPASEPAATTAPTTPTPALAAPPSTEPAPSPVPAEQLTPSAAEPAPTQTQATPPPTEPAPSPVPAEHPTPSAVEPAPTQSQAAPPPATQPASPAAAQDTSEMSEADQLKASIASVPEAERPADPNSVTTTTSPAHANRLLKDSLSSIFAEGLDQRMMAEMPAFWKFYYQAAAAKVDYRPSDPSIYRQNTVDQKAMLLSKFEPDSNEYAQANGVAGMALYHTVVNTDGKAGEIAIARPIGFGLDENAVAAIRKASFQPAVKDGKPVAVLLDLVVQFRIFSKRTSVVLPPDASGKPEPPILPGPYSVIVQ
jgi:TonB family protein